jgi:hypothetical protein
MSSFTSLGVLIWETIALVAVAGFAGGLAIALFMLFGRRSTAPSTSPYAGTPPPALDPLDGGTRPSRRAAPRRAGRHVDILLSDADQVEPPVQAWVIDRSAGGLAIGFLHPIDVGTILSVRPLEGQSVPWVQLEVRQCSELDGGNWRLGCKFVRTPPYSVMMLFG